MKRIELSEDFFVEPVSPNAGESTKPGLDDGVERRAVRIILGQSRRTGTGRAGSGRSKAPPRPSGRRRSLFPLMEFPFQLAEYTIVVLVHMIGAALPTSNGRPGQRHR